MQSRVALLIPMLALLALGGCTTDNSPEGSSSSIASSNSNANESEVPSHTAEKVAPSFNMPEQQWPESGYGSVGPDFAEGCLSIAVPSGTAAYYVKLKSGTSTVWDVFLTPGSNLDFSVPTGTYDMTYGAGETWYGWGAAFGPYGSYSLTSESFEFDSSSCWEVELILQPGGNLESSVLDYQNF